MRAHRLWATLALLGYISSVPVMATAHEFRVGDIRIVHPWARATPPGARVGAGYLTVVNKGSIDDQLIEASSSTIAGIEIHATETGGGISRMRAIPGGLPIPADGRVSLEPGGTHLMLVEPTKPLVQGELVRSTLRFKRAGTVEVEFVVDAIGAPKSASEHD